MKPSKSFQRTLRACNMGIITQAIVINLAPLLFVTFQDRFGLSMEQLGRLVLINFLVQIGMDLLCIKLIGKLGYRRAAFLAQGSAVLGLVALSVLPRIMAPYPGLVLAVMIYSVGAGVLEVCVSPVVDALPSEAKEASMSMTHSFYAWGQVATILLTTLMLRLMGGDLWYWLPLIWAIVPLINWVQFACSPMPPVPEGDGTLSLGGLLTKPLFWTALVMMICAGAAEQAMAQWASFFAERSLGVSKTLGDLMGPCLFALFMGLGRTFYGMFGHRIAIRPALAIGAAGAVVCYVVAALSANPWLSLIACGLCGFAVSVMWPGVLSMTSNAIPGAGMGLFALIAVAGDTGCSTGPWLTGLLADLSELGLRAGLLAAAAFPLILLAGLFFFRLFVRKETKENR